MLRFVSPWWPVAGLTDETCGVPAVTVNPPRIVATSPPVVRVTLYDPVAVEPGIDRFRLACLGSATVTPVTVMPPPTAAVVSPLAKLVWLPVTCTITFVFCAPLAGLRLRIAA
jgi:hypothetical protein